MTNESHKKSPAWMRWTGWGLTVLPSLFLIFGAVMMILSPPEFTEPFAKSGWNAKLLVPLGITVLACTALYLIPQTSTLGAILLTGYMGGAIAHHVRLNESFAFPVVFAIVIWLGLFLREPRLRAILPLRT